MVSARQGRAALLDDALPELADGRVHQLWQSEDGAMRPAGLPDPEPRGGSSAPMSPPPALLTV
ncbi:hypothetical protein ACFYXS_11590 [Streptomyces sp. NPDC002574]|uniref:hypothetical protein n=1 Tax=Streptomyces sp. NPDC002574 TaxID=3364652 RepID=UPI00369B9843